MVTQTVIYLNKLVKGLVLVLEKDDNRIKDIVSLIDQISCFYGIEGFSSGRAVIINDKYVEGVVRLLSKSVDSQTHDLKRAIVIGLRYYQWDLYNEIADWKVLKRFYKTKKSHL